MTHFMGRTRGEFRIKKSTKGTNMITRRWFVKENVHGSKVI